MVRTLCWILAFCSFCALLFFRSDGTCAADGRVPQVTLPRVEQVTLPDRSDLYPLPKTYSEARERAMRTGLPLVVWVGEAVCPACVQRSKEEYVHWVTQSFPDTPKDALVVGLRVGDDLMRIGTMTSWPQPDGHLGTVAKALDLWRAHRQVTDQRGMAYRGGSAAQQPGQMFQAQFYSAPAMSYGSSAYRGGYNGSSRGVFPAFRARGRASGGCST